MIAVVVLCIVLIFVFVWYIPDGEPSPGNVSVEPQPPENVSTKPQTQKNISELCEYYNVTCIEHEFSLEIKCFCASSVIEETVLKTDLDEIERIMIDMRQQCAESEKLRVPRTGPSFSGGV